jgi:hypothetical protein
MPFSCEKNLFDVLRNKNKGASDMTLTSYAANVQKIYYDLNIKDKVFDASLFLDHDKILTHLKKFDYTKNTLKNKLASIVAFLLASDIEKKIIDKYVDDIDAYSSRIEREKTKMIKTEREGNNWLTIAQINLFLNQKKESLSKDPTTYHDFYNLMMYLCGAFHVLFPLRNELADTKIFSFTEFKNIDVDTNFNYLIINQKKKEMELVLYKYKTFKVYGVKNIMIKDPNLYEMFSKYYRDVKNYYISHFDGEFEHYFLFHRDGTPLRRNEFTKLFNRCFESSGKTIGSSMMRKIVVSELYPTTKIRDMAYIMGHSVQEQIHSYVKS